MRPTWAEQAVRPYRIYGLFDPRDGVLFYIDLTRDPRQRELTHGNSFGCDVDRVWRRVQEIRAAGRKFVFRILESYPPHARKLAYAREAFLIRNTAFPIEPVAGSRAGKPSNPSHHFVRNKIAQALPFARQRFCLLRLFEPEVVTGSPLVGARRVR